MPDPQSVVDCRAELGLRECVMRAEVMNTGNHTADLSSMSVTPRDIPRTDVRAELDEALAGEMIEIELQSILKANSGARARHCFSRQLIGAILPQTRYEKCNACPWTQGSVQGTANGGAP
jgi:hypothetical protein